MVHRREFKYDENIDLLDTIYILSRRMGYTLPPGIYEISDSNSMLK